MTLSRVETTCVGTSPCYPMTGTMIHTIRVYTHILHIALAIRVDRCYSVYGVTLRCLYVSGDRIAVIMPNAIIAERLMRHLFKIKNMCLRRIHDKKNSLRDLILHPYS